MDHVGALHFRTSRSVCFVDHKYLLGGPAPLEWLNADDVQRRLDRADSLSLGLVNCAKVAGAQPVAELVVISLVANLLDEFCVLRISDQGALRLFLIGVSFLVVSKSNTLFMSTADFGSRRGD